MGWVGPGRSKASGLYRQDDETNLELLDAASFDSCLGLCRERVVIVVKELLAVEGNETLENSVSNSAGTWMVDPRSHMKVSESSKSNPGSLDYIMKNIPIVPTTLPSRSNVFRATSETTQSPRSIISWAGV